MSDIRGRFLWYELLTTDPAAAIEFYKDVAGWGTREWEGGENPYTMWTVEGTPIGGAMELPAEAVAGGAPPHWLAYIGTPDVDATLERARELGAKALWGPMDIPEVGRMAGIMDPQGAVFAVYTPADAAPEGAEAPPSPGRFSWHELATEDRVAAWAFYSELFGWQETDALDMGEGNMYQMYGRGGPPLGGMFDRPPEMSVSAWTLYVRVPDVAAAVETVKRGGGQVLNGPMEVPGGDLIAQCMDPQGAAFAVHAVAEGGEG